MIHKCHHGLRFQKPAKGGHWYGEENFKTISKEEEQELWSSIEHWVCDTFMQRAEDSCKICQKLE